MYLKIFSLALTLSTVLASPQVLAAGKRVVNDGYTEWTERPILTLQERCEQAERRVKKPKFKTANFGEALKSEEKNCSLFNALRSRYGALDEERRLLLCSVSRRYHSDIQKMACAEVYANRDVSDIKRVRVGIKTGKNLHGKIS